MAVAVSPITTVATFVCPECGILATPASRHEVVAVYCIRHQTATGAVRPIRMDPVEAIP